MTAKQEDQLTNVFYKMLGTMKPHELAMLTVLLSLNRSRITGEQNHMSNDLLDVLETSTLVEEIAESLLGANSENPTYLSICAFNALETLN